MRTYSRKLRLRKPARPKKTTLETRNWGDRKVGIDEEIIYSKGLTDDGKPIEKDVRRTISQLLPTLPIHDPPPPIKTPRPWIEEGGRSEPTPFTPRPCPFVLMVARIFPFVFSLPLLPPSPSQCPQAQGVATVPLSSLLNLQ